MRLPFATASALLLAPQSRKASNKGVALPFFLTGPGMRPMRCRNAARRGDEPVFYGGALMP